MLAPAPPRSRRGLGLLEVAIVLVIAVAACVLLLPALNRSRENARARYCGGNLRRLCQAMAAYHQTHNEFDMLIPKPLARQRSIWPFELQVHLDGSGAEKGADPLNAKRPISLTCPSHPQARDRNSSSHCLYVLVAGYEQVDDPVEPRLPPVLALRWSFRDRERDLPPAAPREKWCTGLVVPRLEADEQLERQLGPHANGVFQEWSTTTQEQWKDDPLRIRADRLAPSF